MSGDTDKPTERWYGEPGLRPDRLPRFRRQLAWCLVLITPITFVPLGLLLIHGRTDDMWDSLRIVAPSIVCSLAMGVVVWGLWIAHFKHRALALFGVKGLTPWWYAPVGVAQSLLLVSPILYSVFLDARPSLIPAILFAGLMAMAVAGFAVLGTVRQKYLGEPVCEKCAYPIDVLQQPDQCSECGQAFTEARGSTLVNTRRRPERVAIGVVLIVVGFGGFLGRGSVMSLISGVLPKPVLRFAAPNSAAALDELINRSLTQADRVDIAERVMEQRVGRTYLGEGLEYANEWVGAQIQAGRFPQDIVDRWYETSVELSLEGPDTAVVGEPVSIVLRAFDHGIGPRGSGGGGMQSRVFLGTPSHGRRDATEDGEKTFGLHALGIQNAASDTLKRFGARVTEEPYTVTLTPTSPGTLEFEWPVYLVHLNGLSRTVDHDDAGTPILDPPPLWGRWITLRHAIDVRAGVRR